MTDLQSKTILVTGSKGFIGSHIKDKLITCGAKVKEFDLADGQDLCSKRDLSCSINQLSKIDGICHQAGLISVSDSLNRASNYIQENLVGTLNLLEAAKTSNIKNVVIASTSAIYGMLSPYAYSKSMVEQLAEMYNKLYGMNIICLRYYNVYGSRQKTASGAIISNLVSKMIKDQSPVIFGDGTQTRDFIHVKDVASANIKALTTKIEDNNSVYEIGYGESKSILNLVDTINISLGKKIQPVFQEVRQGDILNSEVKDIKRTQDFLKWKPEYTLKDGIAETVNWHLLIP